MKSDTVTFSNRFLQIARTAIDFYITVYFLIWKDVQYESVRPTSDYMTSISVQRVKWIKQNVSSHL